MKTQYIMTIFVWAINILIMQEANAHGDQIFVGDQKSLVTEITYDDPAYNRGIHSYPNLIAPRTMDENDVIYIDKANGQAIFSYPPHNVKPSGY
jgi:hypothetical protein